MVQNVPKKSLEFGVVVDGPSGPDTTRWNGPKTSVAIHLGICEGEQLREVFGTEATTFILANAATIGPAPTTATNELDFYQQFAFLKKIPIALRQRI